MERTCKDQLNFSSFFFSFTIFVYIDINKNRLWLGAIIGIGLILRTSSWIRLPEACVQAPPTYVLYTGWVSGVQVKVYMTAPDDRKGTGL